MCMQFMYTHFDNDRFMCGAILKLHTIKVQWIIPCSVFINDMRFS